METDRNQEGGQCPAQQGPRPGGQGEQYQDDQKQGGGRGPQEDLDDVDDDLEDIEDLDGEPSEQRELR